jgi:molybdopterin molybdotransferase
MKDGFLRLVRVPVALEMLFEAIPDTDPPAETVPVPAALGRVTAKDVSAPEDLPGFTRSSMDGFAVKASDIFGASESLPAYLELVGEVLMGRAPGVTVGGGKAARISTGGVLPEGADAVVMVEDTEISGDTVEVARSVAPGENIVRRDEDIARGSILLDKGTVVGAAQIGALAGLGILTIEVFERPVVGIISTGDELVPPEAKPAPGQVRDINSAALAAAVRRHGCEARAYGIVEDELGRLLSSSRRALAECDTLIISGGSSVGVRDVTLDVIAELGRPGVLTHGLYLKPGKPTLLAVCGGKPVLGFPGNPASALAVFGEIFVPVLARLRGEAPTALEGTPRVIEAELDRSIASATGRLELVPVAVNRVGERLVATPIMGKSNLIGTLARAMGNIRVPEGSEGLGRGQMVTVELLD